MDWFAVHTHPRSEFIVKENLERQGYMTYLPMFKKTRRHARKIETISSPLFPRYIFAGVKPDRDGWTKIKFTKGVANVVCFGSRPAKVPINVLKEFREREDDQGFVQLGNTKSLVPGDKVNVLNGFFSQYSGVIEKFAGGDRVFLLLDLLGSKFRLNTTLEHISLSA